MPVGNMGISLAYFSKVFHLNIIIVMPENVSIERIKIIKSLGANVILTSSEEGMNGAINKAIERTDLNQQYKRYRTELVKTYEAL